MPGKISVSAIRSANDQIAAGLEKVRVSFRPLKGGRFRLYLNGRRTEEIVNKGQTVRRRMVLENASKRLRPVSSTPQSPPLHSQSHSSSVSKGIPVVHLDTADNSFQCANCHQWTFKIKSLGWHKCFYCGLLHKVI